MRDVVSRAGYRVTTQTGSAFVASDGRTSFYVWTTEGDAEVAGAQDGWQSLTAVAGTPVYGDEDLWRFWSAQGFIFWVKQGPTPTATLPSPSDLRSLIAASHELPPPPP